MAPEADADRGGGARRRGRAARGGLRRRAARGRRDRVPVGQLDRADLHARQPADGPDVAQPGDRPDDRRVRLELRREHPGDQLAVHPRHEPGGRPGRRRRRDEQRHPAARAGRRRGHLGHRRRAGVRPRHRRRAGRQGQHGRPGPDDQHRARPALGPRLRVDRRGPVPGRAAGRGRHPRRAVRRHHGPGQALRGVQPGDQPQHLERQRGRQHPGRAGDLPARLPGRGAAGRGLVGDVLLQLHQRHRRLPEPVHAEHGAAPAVRLHRLRDLRLGRDPLDRRLRERRPGHGHARQRRLLRLGAAERRHLRAGQPGHDQLGRLATS